MQRLCPSLTIREFADDIAVVAPDLYNSVPTLMRIFLETARVAGLSLNIPKCVLIPLWCVDLDMFRNDFARRFPGWAPVTIDSKGTYLGFVIGPGSENASWAKPIHKFRKAAKFWGQAGLGMQYSMLAYTIYALPILSYVGQLCEPPQEALDAETLAFRDLIPGPGNWRIQDDLWYMGDHFGQARSLPSLRHMCTAAQKRVYLWGSRAQGGLGIGDCFCDLKRAMSCTAHLARIVRWDSWFRRGPVATLHRTSAMLDERGLSSSLLVSTAGWDQIDPDRRNNGIRKAESKFQACTRLALARKDRPDPVGRIRAKLKRWCLGGIERHTAERCSRMFLRLAKLVPPRVAHAVWRTTWNGWTSARRFQQSSHHCLLGCVSSAGQDSNGPLSITPGAGSVENFVFHLSASALIITPDGWATLLRLESIMVLSMTRPWLKGLWRLMPFTGLPTG